MQISKVRRNRLKTDAGVQKFDESVKKVAELSKNEIKQKQTKYPDSEEIIRKGICLSRQTNNFELDDVMKKLRQGHNYTTS